VRDSSRGRGGLFRHYWVVVKLLLIVFATAVLLAKMELIGYAARLAAETTLSRADLRAAGIQLVVHAVGGMGGENSMSSVRHCCSARVVGRRLPTHPEACSQTIQ
jgi:hypothetical protein